VPFVTGAGRRNHEPTSFLSQLAAGNDIDADTGAMSWVSGGLGRLRRGGPLRPTGFGQMGTTASSCIAQEVASCQLFAVDRI
jgi:hypothetical protein